jgi:hypothetical protein
MRKISGVVRASALFGTPDAIVTVEGDAIAAMDAAIDRIVEILEVPPMDSKVARCIN